MAPQKRAASSIISPGSKRKAISIGSYRPSAIPLNKSKVAVSASTLSSTNNSNEQLRREFIDLLTDAEHQQNGITNSQLKATFQGERYVHLVPIINSLTQEARLIMSKTDDELVYKLISEETASKFAGLDVQARMVYQIIEESGNKGIWTKDVRVKSKIQQQALTKIFKNLESRKLIKPVKAVNAKSKKCYMLYDLQPSKEITGGPW